jgi:hypothetical protein
MKMHSIYKNTELKIMGEGVEMQRILSTVFGCRERLIHRGDITCKDQSKVEIKCIDKKL